MAFFDIFTRKKQEKKETSSGSPEFKYAEKKAAECAQNVLSKKWPVPPPFGDDKHFKDAASMLLSMTGALFPSNDTHNESEIDQALSLYAYIFTAKSGGFIPERSESWVVKRRALIRSMKAIEEGIFAREGVQKATQIALEYIYSHIPFFADKDSAYLNSIKEMKSLLLPLSKLASGQKESPDLAASVRSCVQKANQLAKEGHQAWAAEWIEALIDTLSPVDPCYDDPSGKALLKAP